MPCLMFLGFSSRIALGHWALTIQFLTFSFRYHGLLPLVFRVGNRKLA